MCLQDTALLTLLLDTGRLRYSSTPKRATTPSPEPPECLTYSSFGRKMLKYSIMASSLPASGSWLHGLKGSQDGAAEDTLENVNSAVHSIDLAEKNTAWVRTFCDYSDDSDCSIASFVARVTAVLLVSRQAG